MNQWYVKDLSKLVGISVQTLHHYDKLGLLKPSVRRANGYRCYSEVDLQRLQQILALKFFGFELAKIKTLLDKNSNVLDHFKSQAKALELQAKNLAKIQQTLAEVIFQSSDNKQIPWENIIKLIKEFTMYIPYKHDSNQQKHYEAELLASGKVEKKVLDKVKLKVSKWSQQDWAKVNQQISAAQTSLIELYKQNLEVENPAVQKLIKQHFAWIKNFWQPDKESYKGLAQFYVENVELCKFYNQFAPGFAKFLSEAMLVFADKNL